MPKSVEEMTATMLHNLEANTGKSLEQWVQIVQQTGLSKHKEMMSYLMENYQLSYGFANLIALTTRQAASGGPQTGQELVDAQYAGDKAALLPIYQALVGAISEFGEDVEFSPKKAYVSVRRSKQFAIIQPTTKTRLDVGINLKGVEPKGRLEASGSFNSMVSHRVRLERVDQVDKELLGWLQQAYQLA